MLIGNYLTKLDIKKGRTALPKKFRQLLGKKIIITNGYENSLMVISQTSWQKVVGEIVNKPFLSSSARNIDRFLLGSAFEVKLDNQGRFIIPLSLRKYAHLSQDIIFVGIGNRIEIWDKEKWLKQKQYLQKNIKLISEKLKTAEK